MYTVYKHTAPNGKTYIGQTLQDPAARWRNGEGYKLQKLFYRAIVKYGWENITHEIIAEGLTKEAAAALEIKLIAQYESKNPAKGYNASAGGVGGCLGYHHDKATRQRMAKARTGENHFLYGKHRTKEERLKMSKALLGRKISEEHRQNISKATSGENNPNFGKLSPFKGIPRTAEVKRKLSRANTGKRRSEETRRNISEAKNKAVVCVENGAIYLSQLEAAEKTGTNKGNISAACCGKRQTAGGYHWKFLQEG